MSAWGNSWGAAWGGSWGAAVAPPIATLILGAISLRPALAASARMVAALGDDGVSGRSLMVGTIATDRSDQ
ncbi:MAG: hypothetical protein EOR77_21605 [Mesorhizobium sp.]|uniref:hypothetical protein n=1 Tax=Mesorhizobium sp. TaxID=1871066 RepID=UPI000FE73538|nr:hypothetical protein [Mesorhizobium sp.]RWH86447.1 MAG: hypothetical protein EOQ87_26510 [Mesorhizobium sp.]RWM32271.1 MAG: hypothetical protein EOR77_21605 [Mesorhizobium sp.]TJV33771.1 MAG: hypothetical protein E5X87_10585 [Mesorhizobium sp.]